MLTEVTVVSAEVERLVHVHPVVFPSHGRGCLLPRFRIVYPASFRGWFTCRAAVSGRSQRQTHRLSSISLTFHRHVQLS